MSKCTTLATEPIVVYFNSACPVCKAGIESQRSKESTCEIKWVDVHANPHAADAVGVELNAVRERLHVRDAAGALHIGSDAFKLLWSKTPSQHWLARLVGWPLVRQVAHVAYNAFARLLCVANRALNHW